MELIKQKLGQFIELLNVRNIDLKYGEDDVRGVNNLKQLMPTKADISSRDLSKFQIVAPSNFVFNHRTSRNGSKFSIAYNDMETPIICTEDYVVFQIKPEYEKTLIAEWLYLYFNRPEFDRYVIANSWGSSTEFYNWEDICEVELVIPAFQIQQKYVDIYNAMIANQRSYERGLEDLKLTTDALIEKFKHNTERIALGKLVIESDERNIGSDIRFVNGVNRNKVFMPSVANGADLSKYKIVRYNQFACNLMHIGRDAVVPIALQQNEEALIVSPAYLVFNLDEKRAVPKFALMWLSREETDRYAWFMCDTNVRSGMEKKRFYDIEIPIPTIDEQNAVVELFEVLSMRRIVNEKLKAQIKDLCPILIKGSVEEASA